MVVKKTKIESHPKYKDILLAWEQKWLPLIQEKKKSPYEFYKRIVLPIIPDLGKQSFYNWAQSKGVEKVNKEIIADTKDVDKELHQLMLSVDNVTPGEMVQISDKMARVIRVWARFLMHRQVYDLVKNPASLKKMSFAQALKLFDIITREEAKDKELRLKERAAHRDDVYTIFRLGIATGIITPEKLATIRAKVKERRDAYYAKKGLNKDDGLRENEQDDPVRHQPTGQTPAPTDTDKSAGGVSGSG